MNCSLPWICDWLMPMLLSCSSRRCQDGSTFSELKPFCESKPMCATCLNAVGAPIIDLSMPLFRFLLDDDLLLDAATALACVFLAARGQWERNRQATNRRAWID